MIHELIEEHKLAVARAFKAFLPTLPAPQGILILTCFFPTIIQLFFQVPQMSCKYPREYTYPKFGTTDIFNIKTLHQTQEISYALVLAGNYWVFNIQVLWKFPSFILWVILVPRTEWNIFTKMIKRGLLLGLYLVFNPFNSSWADTKNWITDVFNLLSMSILLYTKI